MTYAASIVQVNVSPPAVDANLLAEGIRACFDCAQACTADADADLGEQQVRTMLRCIRLCLDCADVCLATGRMLSRQVAFDPGTARSTLAACIHVCQVCGDECQLHAQHGFAHCQACLEACRRCEQACQAVLVALPASI